MGMAVGVAIREVMDARDRGKTEFTGPRDLHNVKCKGQGKVQMNGYLGDFEHDKAIGGNGKMW